MPHLDEDEVQNSRKSALYTRFAATILTYLSQLVSNKQDAEDLLLEVFMAACNNEMLLGLPAERQLAWLRRVARNKAVDRYRHTARLTMLPLDQARETEDDLSLRLEEMPAQQPGQTRSGPIVSISSRRGHVPRFVMGLVAALVVGILVSASLLLFRSSLHQNAARPPIDATGPTAHTQVNSLQASIHLVTQGPYFLSELVSVDVSLTNHSRMSFGLDGSNRPDSSCFTSALSAQITGGSAPSYTLPRLDIACAQPGLLTTLAPGQTLTIHHHLPVTKSGEVTIMMAGIRGPHQASPLDGHWPSLRIHVDAQVPSNRGLSLHDQGAQVMIEAPATARAHLLYMESITCDQYLGGGPADWIPLSTTVLSQPACPTAHKHWQYIVSAPGYAIVAGNRDS